MTRDDYLRVCALRDADEAVEDLCGELLLILGSCADRRARGAEAQAALLVAVRRGALEAGRGQRLADALAQGLAAAVEACELVQELLERQRREVLAAGQQPERTP